MIRGFELGPRAHERKKLEIFTDQNISDMVCSP